MKNEWKKQGNKIVVKIERRNGEVIHFKIDADDFDKVDRCKSWGLHTGRLGFNYIRATGKSSAEPLFLHRLLMNTRPEDRCIFIDGNSLNCCKKNLKNVNHFHINGRSRSLPKELWHISVIRNRYEVEIWENGKMRYIGMYKKLKDAQAAVKAYRDQKQKEKGEQK